MRFRRLEERGQLQILRFTLETDVHIMIRISREERMQEVNYVELIGRMAAECELWVIKAAFESEIKSEVYIDLLETTNDVYRKLTGIKGPMMKRTSGLTDQQVEERKKRRYVAPREREPPRFGIPFGAIASDGIGVLDCATNGLQDRIQTGARAEEIELKKNKPRSRSPG